MNRVYEKYLKTAGMILICALFLFYLSGCIMQMLYGDMPDTLESVPGIYALGGLNSPYDDFNAAAVPPPLKMDAFILFASNAETMGKRFSLETGRLQITQNPYSSRKQGLPPPLIIAGERTGPFALVPGSASNHLGPTPLVSSSVPERPYEETFSHYLTLSLNLDKEPLAWSGQGHLPSGGVWMFDSDQEGNRNLYFLDENGQIRPFFGNLPGADDAYATYDFKRHELYFSSNRSGLFRIYRYRNATKDVRFSRWLGDISLAEKIEPATEFTAQGNTLAPYIEGNLLVFASDRPGGYGGYDLYASRYEDGRWQKPFNMQKIMPRGVELNTPANEFRPSIMAMSLKDYQQLRLLIFSSDRPGGMGGYDLYLTALPQGE